jgi:formylglycine-generating enzyme required for sulfatase activity
MADIFIRYVSEDRPRAQVIAQALEAEGWTVWWDRRISAGRTFRQVIDAEPDEPKHKFETGWTPPNAAVCRRCIAIAAVLLVILGGGGYLASKLIRPSVIKKPQPQASPRDGYVKIPAGEFWMGAVPGDRDAQDSEKPRHRVRITKAFWMSQTLTTVAAYQRFVKEHPGRNMPPPPAFNPNWTKSDHPMNRVTWDEAKAYCESVGGRLPTEAEWEYAARGGKHGLKYPSGNRITSANANFADTKNETSPVRTYPPNNWGLFDMAGNLWEWVADWYDQNYYQIFPTDKPVDDPRGPETGEVRVLRGGSFFNGPGILRASFRYWYLPDFRIALFGFRCVREVCP